MSQFSDSGPGVDPAGGPEPSSEPHHDASRFERAEALEPGSWQRAGELRKVTAFQALGELFFRPSAFFRSTAMAVPFWFLALAYALCGVSNAIGRIETRTLAGSKSFIFTQDSWVIFWVTALFLGLISGFFLYALGGWWYRKRLAWSGAEDPDKDLTRRVYGYALTVIALPSVVITLIETLVFATPRESFNDDALWPVVAVVFLFWSVWASWTGVTTCFGVIKKRAVWWFLILPTVMYSVVVIGMIVAGLLLFFAAPADLIDTDSLESDTISLSYPGNWSLTKDADFDPDWNIEIEPMHDAVLRLMVYAADSLEDEVEASFDLFSDLSTTPPESWNSMPTWGPHEGAGREFSIELEGHSYTTRVFVVWIGNGYAAEVNTLHLPGDADEVVPGFDFIVDSLEFTAPEEVEIELTPEQMEEIEELLESVDENETVEKAA